MPRSLSSSRTRPVALARSMNSRTSSKSPPGGGLPLQQLQMGSLHDRQRRKLVSRGFLELERGLRLVHGSF